MTVSLLPKEVRSLKLRETRCLNGMYVVHAPINPAVASRIVAVCGAARAKARVVSSQHNLLNLTVYAAGVLGVDRAQHFPPAGSRVW
jgi:hypothetical protein